MRTVFGIAPLVFIGFAGILPARAETGLASAFEQAWQRQPVAAAQAERQKGEFVLVLHGALATPAGGEGERVLRCLLAELPLKTAVRLAAEITGEPRNALYGQALALKGEA